MKLLFSSPHSPEVGLLKDLLAQAGIPCEVRNENLYSNFPGVPFQPEIWVLNDDDYPRACEIRDSRAGPSAENRAAWICPVGSTCPIILCAGHRPLLRVSFFRGQDLRENLFRATPR